MSLVTIVENLALKANIELRRDVSMLLAGAFRKEKVKKAKQALKIIMENARIAKEEGLALCQDTGLPLVFLEVGYDIALSRRHIDQINQGIIKGYRTGNFRASTIGFNNKMTYTSNIVHVEFTKTKGLAITVFPKGFGSENKTKLKLFLPTVSQQEIDAFVVEAVREAGPSACPPYIVGIGIGGTSDYCLLLAKKALLQRLDVPDKDRQLTQWAKRLYKKINALKIGPMGLKGSFTCLGVRIKRHSSHVAGLPVGVNISCHALRSASINLSASQLRY